MTNIESKQIKRENLLSASYDLFIRKGVNDTSISDITESAGVAKGTFYLYFIDKWDIYEQLIIERSYLLFKEALMYINEKNIKKFPDKLINIFDYIIDSFTNDSDLLKFIGRNLSLGIYNNIIKDEYTYQYDDIKSILEKEMKEYNKNIKRPDIILFMMIELISSCCYEVILNSKPVEIEKFKPFLHKEIKKMID